ncbi:MAG TPA: hypothetical protein PL009_13055 [Flavipsychrobacter sp.]|nr:hypothetical protein [Flavipsychrobacter sp.]
MKTFILIWLGAAGLVTWSACNRANGSIQAIDLETGEKITVIEDIASGKIVNEKTGEPVKLFVNRKTNDTVYGVTGEVVNGKLSMSDEGKYVYYGKVKGDGYKMEVERDGDYTIKRGDDYKEKYENGEYKVKHGDYKKEVERDGDVTIKKGDKKIKIDGETGEVKVKN